MYNRYVPGSGGYTRVTVEETPAGHTRQHRDRQHRTDHAQGRRSRPDVRELRSFFAGEDKNAGIAGILKSLHLEDLDSGDILLLLIILFVFLEGDNIELVITLGLMLLLGLGDEKKEDQKE